jgi:hypothetical protein
MGADNLAQFNLWKDWREIAHEMPIAVIARPGYDAAALASPAMAWLRRYRLAAVRMKNRHEWSAPALIELRFDPDPRSATAMRRTDPDWASRFAGTSPRDGVTHSFIHDPAHEEHGACARAAVFVHSARSMTLPMTQAQGGRNLPALLSSPSLTCPTPSKPKRIDPELILDRPTGPAQEARRHHSLEASRASPTTW